MDYIELFAGIGGFRVGLGESSHGREPRGARLSQEAPPRFHCIFANEWDKYARAVYRYHFGECDGRDITTVPIGDIPSADLIVGGPPCQDFSVAGGRAGIEGDRGNLMFTTIEIIQGKRPRYFLLENVPGLLSSGGGRDFANIIDALWQGGDYCIQWVVLNSKDFGVPQNRERVFIVGSLRGEPQPEILPVGTTPQLNPELERLPEAVGQCSPNITARGAGEYHSGMILIAEPRIRRLTPLECERLQGFPDNWTAKGIDDNGKEIEISDTQRYKMTGNAVTTNVIAHFARALVNTYEPPEGK